MTEDDAALAERLLGSRLEIRGRLASASNLTCLVSLEGGGAAVYKPVSGTRPLHDFDTSTLAAREVAAYRLSEAGGWHVVPVTVLREGPLGPGSVQWWVDTEGPPGEGLVQVAAAEEVPEGWLPVLRGEDELGTPVVVAHADRPDLAGVAVLDVLLNNADRKAAHLLLDPADRLWACDHGLCLHEHDKLRTVLWGWHGRPVPAQDLQRLRRVRAALAAGEPLRRDLEELVGAEEVRALTGRVTGLLARPVMPDPPAGRYPLPWPIW